MTIAKKWNYYSFKYNLNNCNAISMRENTTFGATFWDI